MKDKEWFELFDKTKHTFQWFYLDYGFEKQWNDLLWYRVKEERYMMEDVMNEIWFLLPDNRFNIIEDPKGWREYLTLIES